MAYFTLWPDHISDKSSPLHPKRAHSLSSQLMFGARYWAALLLCTCWWHYWALLPWSSISSYLQSDKSSKNHQTSATSLYQVPTSSPASTHPPLELWWMYLPAKLLMKHLTIIMLLFLIHTTEGKWQKPTLVTKCHITNINGAIMQNNDCIYILMSAVGAIGVK